MHHYRKACPVKTMEDNTSASQTDLIEILPLFRALATTRSKQEVWSQGISHSRVRTIIIKDAFRGLIDVS